MRATKIQRCRCKNRQRISSGTKMSVFFSKRTHKSNKTTRTNAKVWKKHWTVLIVGICKYSFPHFRKECSTFEFVNKNQHLILNIDSETMHRSYKRRLVNCRIKFTKDRDLTMWRIFEAFFDRESKSWIFSHVNIVILRLGHKVRLQKWREIEWSSVKRECRRVGGSQEFCKFSCILVTMNRLID